MLKKAFILIFLALLGLSKAQIGEPVLKNIVPNGSFENYRKKSNSIRQAIPWTQIASVDYYQDIIPGDTGRARGARTGKCFAGVRFQKRYKEFLQVKLTEALHRGTTYEFEMYVRLAWWSNATVKSMGVLFTKGGYHGPGDAVRACIIDSICKKGGFINNYQWIKISGKYKSDGGEKYITIGNFYYKIQKELVRINIFKRGFREAYYFIDDVSIYKMKEPEEKVAIEYVGSFRANEVDSVLEVGDVKVGEKITLKNIFFENGKYYLLPESYVELNKLAQYLLRHPKMEIQINGHSDNSGMKYKNQKISEQRAREVFEYLIKKGAQNKMYFKGFGSSLPIAPNDTDEGKAKNRRVEFEIIKN